MGRCFVFFAVRSETPVAEYDFSPYELLFGRYVRGPFSIVNDAWWESGENEASENVVEYMVNLRGKLETAIEYANCKQRDAQGKNKVWYDKKLER